MNMTMPRYLNGMTVLGHFLQDPWLCHFYDGTAVLRITLETRSENRDEFTNEIIRRREQHHAVLYGIEAEQVAGSTRRGDRLWICGPLCRRRFA